MRTLGNTTNPFMEDNCCNFLFTIQISPHILLIFIRVDIKQMTLISLITKLKHIHSKYHVNTYNNIMNKMQDRVPNKSNVQFNQRLNK